jgi:hypothetical protein
MVLLLVVEATELVDVAEVVEVPPVARKAADAATATKQIAAITATVETAGRAEKGLTPLCKFLHELAPSSLFNTAERLFELNMRRVLSHM